MNLYVLDYAKVTPANFITSTVKAGLEAIYVNSLTEIPISVKIGLVVGFLGSLSQKPAFERIKQELRRPRFNYLAVCFWDFGPYDLVFPTNSGISYIYYAESEERYLTMLKGIRERGTPGAFVLPPRRIIDTALD